MVHYGCTGCENTQFALTAQIKTANAMFPRAQNKWKSYKNIQCACFCMLDENVANQFKVSNVSTLTGWNRSMSIRAMLDQLKGTYGKPDTMTLFANNTLFWKPFNLVDAPEALFYRIEQCQEIQVLAHDPYLDMQVINSAVCVCVCSCPPVMRGILLIMRWQALVPPPNDIPSIPWSPVVLPLWTPWGAC